MKRLSTLSTTIAIGLLLLGSFLYLHGFRGRLPYYLDPDEPFFYLAASEIRSTGRVQTNPLYPPLRPYQMAATQWLIDTVSGNRATPKVNAIFARAESAYFAVILLAVLYRLGRDLHSRLAGLFAAGLLLPDAQIVTFSHVARGDTLAWLMTAGVMLGTLRLLRRETRADWVLVILCSLGAFLAKYSAAPIGLLTGYLILRKLIPNPRLQAAVVIAVLAAGAALVLHIRANESAWLFTLAKTGFGFLLLRNFDFLKTLSASAESFRSGIGNAWLLTGCLFLPLPVTLERSRFTKPVLTLFALLIVAVLGMVAVFSVVVARYHDVYTVVLIWYIFGGLALAILAEKGRWLGLLIALGLIGLASGPRLGAAWAYGEAYTTPYTLADLGDWFMQHVPQGARAVVEQSTPFNAYAGFPGRQAIYHQYNVESMFDETAEAYRERGYEYLVWSSKGVHPAGYSDPQTLAGQPYFKNARLVLQLTAEAARGPRLLVFQLPAVQQHVMYAWFTPAISFRGYDLNQDTFQPGDELRLMLYWMSAEPIKANYVVFVHLLDPSGKLLAGQDGPPDYGNTPTWKWLGDMQFIRDQRLLPLPADAKPGTYTLCIGMYDADTGARVQVLDLQNQPIGDGLTLQTIVVK